MTLRQLVAAPIWRVRQEVEWTIPGAVVAALAAWQDRSAEVFVALVVGLAIASVVDSSYGRRRARLEEARGEGKYDPVYAAMGLHSKIIGLILVLLLRGGEWIVGLIGWDTHGAAAVVMAGVLFIREWKSLDGHRVAFGAGPIPVVHQLLTGVERLLELSLGSISDPPRRRKGDRRVQPTTPEA